MAELGALRFAEKPGSDEQFLSAPVTPTTPTYGKGYFDHDDDHDDHEHHHEKKSVLAKVKDKARKWRHMLAKKKHGHQEDDNSTPSWEGSLDEVDYDDDEQDPEYHGAPMYESEMAPSAYKETTSQHSEETPSPYSYKKSPLRHQSCNSSNKSALQHVGDEHDEPALHHLDAFRERETSINNITANPSALSDIHRSDANVKHGDPIKETSIRHIMATYPANSDIHRFEAKAKLEELIVLSDEHLLEAKAKHEHPLESKTKHGDRNKGASTDHILADHSEHSEIHLVQANTKHKDPTNANRPAISDINLLEANAKHKDPSEETLNHQIMTNLAAFSDIHHSHANSKHRDPIKEASTHHNMANHPAFSDKHLLKADEKHDALMKDVSTHNIMANHHAISDTNRLEANTKHRHDTSTKHDDFIDETSTRHVMANRPAFSDTYLPEANVKDENTMKKRSTHRISNAHLLEANSKHKGSIKKPSTHHIMQNHSAPSNIHNLDANVKPIKDTSTHHITANRPALSNKHPLEDSKKHGDPDKESGSNRTLTETVSEMLTPAYAVVSDASHTIASTILCPTDGDDTRATQGLDPVKDLTDTVSEMLAPAYTAVSEASHIMASKIHGPKAREEIGTKLVQDRSKGSDDHKTLTGTVSGMLSPAYTMVSDASLTIASKIQGPTAEDEMGAKLAHDPKERAGHKTLTETVSGMIAPAHTRVTDATHKIASKVHVPKDGDEIGEKHVWDKGVSVKEYLMQKLEPGEEERALSQVITEAMSPKKTSQGQAEEISVVEKVKGAVCSLLGKGGHKEPTIAVSSPVVMEEHAGPILPISTNPHAVEFEARGERRLQTYTN